MIQPPISEITIYFKPLGLNNFVSNLSDFFKQNKSYHFSPFPDFADNMTKILKENSTEQQVKMLEEYWISKLNVKDFTRLKSILYDLDNGLNVESIAKKHNYTRQHILKLFQSHMGKKIAEYKKIHRFKNTLRKKEGNKHLTELAHSNQYYDQSHFIKDFKELTNLTPTTFFKNVDVDKPTIWQFIK